jgi:D-glycero-alpha-D-manno-heptose-7-phosphate kinase
VSETIVTRAPTRIDFGGGWTDVPPYSDEMGGYVCNLAIARYATVTVTPGAGESLEAQSERTIASAAAHRFRMKDARIECHSDFPISAGLGGSSAAGVATVAALAAARKQTLQPAAIAELSREIEIGDLGVPGGRQDHYAAAYGGALGLRFSAGGRVDVREISLGARVRAEIERRCLVIYTGQSRISSDTINAVLGAYRDREPGVIKALAGMRGIAEFQSEALARGDIDGLGRLVAEQWKHQRSLHPMIPTPLIDQIIGAAKMAGAIGSKALGASGGGCVLVVAGANKVDSVRSAIESLGEMLPFKVDESGVERCR